MNVAYWQPRVMRHTLPNGRTEYAVHDVFFRPDGKVETYVVQARSPRKASVAELEAWIRSILAEGKAEVVCGDLGYAHSADDHLSHWLEHVHDLPLDFEPEGDVSA